MSMSTSLPASRTRVRDVLDDVLSGLETVRLADRTGASDQDRLSWVEKLVEAERRVGALKSESNPLGSPQSTHQDKAATIGCRKAECYRLTTLT